MKRVLIRNAFCVTALLSAFLIGIAIPSIVGPHESSKTERLCARVPVSDSSELPCTNADYSLLPAVTYCDLMATPQDYENKLVRLRYDYFKMGIGMLRRDDICTKGASDFHIDIEAGANNAATEGLMNAWNAGLLPKGTTFMLVGRFRKAQTSLTESSHNYKLELLKINDVVIP